MNHFRLEAMPNQVNFKHPIVYSNDLEKLRNLRHHGGPGEFL